MKVNPPKVIIWWISCACAAIGVLSALKIIIVPALTPYLFWVVVLGLILLLLATVLPGL